MTDRYRLYGVLGSPYAAKLRALFRYRRLPFDWIPAGLDWAPDYVPVRPEIAAIRPTVIPVVWFPHDGSHRNDSTVIAYDLEALHRDRSILPTDPATAFLSHLLEDMGDEWCLKIAFHYRWGSEDDRNYTNRSVMAEVLGGGVPQATIEAAAQQFRDRQMSRMPLVGCTPQNAPIIEATYARVLDVIARLRESQAFLFGSRPSLGDFGLFGALFTCRNDPTPGAIMRRTSPATLDWIAQLDEGSGIEGTWEESGVFAAPVLDLLRLAGATYLPFLEANARAVEHGKPEVALTLLGRPYRQNSFRYQAKCLAWLRSEYAAVAGAARTRLDAVLDETGCLPYLQ